MTIFPTIVQTIRPPERGNFISLWFNWLICLQLLLFAPDVLGVSMIGFVTRYKSPPLSANYHPKAIKEIYAGHEKYSLRYQPQSFEKHSSPGAFLRQHLTPTTTEPPLMDDTMTTAINGDMTEETTVSPDKGVSFITTTMTTFTNTTPPLERPAKPLFQPFGWNLAQKVKQLIGLGLMSPIRLWHHRNPLLSNRQNKPKGFLNLFEVIQFENSKCSVSMGDIRSMSGTCYHEFECQSLGGIATESCADGVGVCCICK